MSQSYSTYSMILPSVSPLPPPAPYSMNLPAESTVLIHELLTWTVLKWGHLYHAMHLPRHFASKNFFQNYQKK